MAVFKCKQCGGKLDVKEGCVVVKCEWCDNEQTVSTTNNEKILKLIARGNELRNENEFDKAYSVFEQARSESDGHEDAEIYWNLLLCKYGITYVDDYDGKKKPTMNRYSDSSILDDGDYKKVLGLANVIAKEQYEKEANTIASIQNKITTIVRNEKPYDIFISYKETDPDGERTEDSVYAQEIYDKLRNEGYRVFLSRVTLSSIVGKEYEPYIYSALYSSKIMLLVTTSIDYVNAVWVKNEWSRFLEMMKKDLKKHFIPCFKNVDFDEMPKVIRNTQGVDMSKIGYWQDLMIGIKKLLGKGTNENFKDELEKLKNDLTEGKASEKKERINNLIKRCEIALESRNWEEAKKKCEDVLNLDPEHPKGYYYRMLADLKKRNSKEFEDGESLVEQLYKKNPNYTSVVLFADEEVRKSLNIWETNAKYLSTKININLNTLESLTQAKEDLETIINFKDSKELLKKIPELCNEVKYIEALKYIDKNTHKSLDSAEKILNEIKEYKDSKKLLSQMQDKHNEIKYVEAREYIKTNTLESLEKAEEILNKIRKHKDSSSLISEIPDLKKDVIYNKYKDINCDYEAESDEEKTESIKNLTKVIENLKEIKDWKDTENIITKYNTELTYYNLILKSHQYSNDNVKLKEYIQVFKSLNNWRESQKHIKEIESSIRKNNSYRNYIIANLAIVIVCWLCCKFLAHSMAGNNLQPVKIILIFVDFIVTLAGVIAIIRDEFDKSNKKEGTVCFITNLGLCILSNYLLFNIRCLSNFVIFLVRFLLFFYSSSIDVSLKNSIVGTIKSGAIISFIIFLICIGGINMGNSVIFKVLKDPKNDPKDYYGITYSCYDDTYIYSFEFNAKFNANECIYKKHNKNGAVIETQNYKYEYVSAEYLKKYIDGYDEEYSGILIYTKKKDLDTAIIFKVIKSSPDYQFLWNELVVCELNSSDGTQTVNMNPLELNYVV